jgi:hypothetical protein
VEAREKGVAEEGVVRCDVEVEKKEKKEKRKKIGRGRVGRTGSDRRKRK